MFTVQYSKIIDDLNQKKLDSYFQTSDNSIVEYKTIFFLKDHLTR